MPKGIYKRIKLKPLADRFHKKHQPVPFSGCWLWTAAAAGNGYGYIGRGRAGEGMEYAHRVSWKIHKGPIPKGKQVLHRCDTPPCVNPDHLFLGDVSANMRDCVAKGRHNAGRGVLRKLCRKGHGLIGENVLVDARGLRRCRICRKNHLIYKLGVPNSEFYMEQGLFSAPQVGVNRLDYLSPSKMSLILENPRKFFWKYSPTRQLKEAKTKSLDLGKLCHKFLLEPGAAAKMVLEKEFSGTGSKAAKQEWIASLPPGTEIIDPDKREAMMKMVDAVMREPEARALLETAQGSNEVCGYAKREDGIWLHGKFDRLIAGPGIVELKTTSGGVDWDAFVWDVYEYNYHMALAVYLEIASIVHKKPVTESAWVVLQQVEPYSCRVHYPQDEDMLDIGRFDMNRAIDRWRDLMIRDPGLAREEIWFSGRQPKEEGPARFPYHILIRRPEWQQFLTGVK